MADGVVDANQFDFALIGGDGQHALFFIVAQQLIVIISGFLVSFSGVFSFRPSSASIWLTANAVAEAMNSFRVILIVLL